MSSNKLHCCGMSMTRPDGMHWGTDRRPVTKAGTRIPPPPKLLLGEDKAGLAAV